MDPTDQAQPLAATSIGAAPPANPLRHLEWEQLQHRTSAKWRSYPMDVLPVWIAEMDVQLAAPVKAAVTEAVARGDTGYAAGSAYAEALVDFARHRWGWAPDPASTAIVPDVMLGMVEVLKLVTEPGDAVVISPPLYPPIRQFTENLGRRVLHAPLDRRGRLDPVALDEAFGRATHGGRPAAYVLCNPHNPTGTVHTADELGTLAKLAAAHRVRVIADEIHAPLTLPGAAFVPYLSLPGTDDAVALISASKAWNLAGLKAALAIAAPGAAADLARLPEEVSHGPSHLGVIAHTAALQHAGPWLDALLTDLDENRALLGRLLADHLPGVRWSPQQGGFLAWLDCRALGLGDDPAAVFLERGRVALNSGPSFGPGGEGHARLNLATTPELLSEAVRRMAAAC